MKQPESNLPLEKSIQKYAVPAILSCLIGALYNIIDQIFIGHIIGVEGNAATNVAFPLVTITIALMLFMGIGGTANFSIAMGKKDQKNAEKFVGMVLVGTPIIGLMVSLFAIFWTEPLVWFFGATEQNIHLATTYVSIVAFGYPFFMTGEACTKLIRADGSPKYSTFCSLVGAGLNCILNPIFMIHFNMGIAGAAWATVVGQVFACGAVLHYFTRFQSFKIKAHMLVPTGYVVKRIVMLGTAPAINQFAMASTQIVLNNTLVLYGAESVYGTEIPLACVGVITKVTSIYMAVMIGIAQGAQPLLGYHYGAKQYDVVKNVYMLCAKYASILSIFAFLLFQTFPRQIISLFGVGDALYYEFGELYFHTFLFMTFLNGIQPITGNFFTAIGKPIKSVIVSVAKQLFFLIPLIIMLPKVFGISGILWAGPIADLLTFLITMGFVSVELKGISGKMEENVVAIEDV